MHEVGTAFQSTDGRRRPQPEEGPVRVIHEDDHLIVLDKPPGMVVHPTYKNASGTLLNAVLWHVRHRADAQPGILTRLDKDTSGVVVIALTPAGHATLQRDQAAGRVRKEYLAVVRGLPHPPADRIVEPLARDAADRRRVVVVPEGQYSETHYEVVSQADDIAMVRCTLVTGRTHQIRVHLATRGWPVIGDAVYGSPDEGIARQALHAWRVTVPHPSTRQLITIEAPVPDDIRTLAVSRGLKAALDQRHGVRQF